MSSLDGGGVEWVTREEVLADWNALFDTNPWLEGLACEGTCGDVLCCAPGNLPDWFALSRARDLLFLGGSAAATPVLTRSLLQPVEGDPGAVAGK